MFSCGKYIYFLFLFFMSFGYAFADRSSCIISSRSESLLGGATDSPLIPVQINGNKVALFLGPKTDEIYLVNSNYMNLDKYIIKNSYAYVYNDLSKMEKSRILNLDSLYFAGFFVRNVKAVLLNEPFDQKINEVPIVGIMGNKVLKNFSVLLDITHKRVVFYDVVNNCKNREEIKNILGGDYKTVPMENDEDFPRIKVKISGHEFYFYIDLDIDVTEIPIRIIKNNNIRISGDGHENSVRFSLGEGYISTVYSIDDFSIGNYNKKNMKVKISDKIENGSVGLDFFSNSIVLMDFINNVMYFRIVSETNKDFGHNLHFDKNKISNVYINNGK